ncbi:MAG TPA: shikimate kinase [Actinomycetota bacterium]|jgi:shikimate kinase
MTSSGMQGTIALIGPMGAGKSEVGAVLARRLSRPLVDTDELIVEVAGMPILRIFEQEGERGFRALEAAAVRQAAATPGAVVACGGGAVLDPANVHVLRTAGVVVYLQVSPEVAAARVGDAEGRPLLAGGDPGARLAALIGERSAAYERAAHLVVDGTPAAEEVASAIVALLERDRVG